MTLVNINTLSPNKAHSAIFVLIIHAHDCLHNAAPFDPELVASLAETIRAKIVKRTMRLDAELEFLHTAGIEGLVAALTATPAPIPQMSPIPQVITPAIPSPLPVSPVASPALPSPVTLLPSPVSFSKKQYVIPESDTLVQYFFDPNTSLDYLAPAWFAEPYIKIHKRMSVAHDGKTRVIGIARLAVTVADRIGLAGIDEYTTSLCIDGKKTIKYL